MQIPDDTRSLKTVAVLRAAAALFIAGLAAPASSQTTPPPVAEEVSLSGPRVGVTFLSDGVVAKLRQNQVTVGSIISQFGWQFERRIFNQNDGITMMTEWVVLVGGLEQSVVLPSVSWMVGLRTRNGAEIGIGPNLTPAGPALAIAGGVTFRIGALNFPVNLAVVPSKSGLRVSVLSGFNRR